MEDLRYRNRNKSKMRKEENKEASIGPWMIGIVVGGGLMALSLLVVDFIQIVIGPDMDFLRGLYLTHSFLWIIGSFILSFSTMIPGFTNKGLNPGVRTGLIIAGVLCLIMALVHADTIVPTKWLY